MGLCTVWPASQPRALLGDPLHSTSQQAIAYDVKGSENFTQGERSKGPLASGELQPLLLSTLRSRLVCAMEGDFSSKGAIKMGALKSFQTCSHINKKLPDAGLTRIAFNLSKHTQISTSIVGNASIDWSSATAQTALLTMYDLRYTLKSTSWAMGLDWTKLPKKCDPSYGHPITPSLDQDMEQSSQPMMKSRKISQTNAKEASFDDLVDHLQDGYWSAQADCQSSSSTTVWGDLAGDVWKTLTRLSCGVSTPRIFIESSIYPWASII